MATGGGGSVWAAWFGWKVLPLNILSLQVSIGLVVVNLQRSPWAFATVSFFLETGVDELPESGLLLLWNCENRFPEDGLLECKESHLQIVFRREEVFVFLEGSFVCGKVEFVFLTDLTVEGRFWGAIQA